MKRKLVSATRLIMLDDGEVQSASIFELEALKGAIQIYQCHLQKSAMHGRLIEADGEIEHLIKYFLREPSEGTAAHLMWRNSFYNQYFPSWTKTHTACHPSDPFPQAMLGIV